MPPKTTAVAGKPKLSTKRIRKSRTECKYSLSFTSWSFFDMVFSIVSALLLIAPPRELTWLTDLAS